MVGVVWTGSAAAGCAANGTGALRAAGGLSNERGGGAAIGAEAVGVAVAVGMLEAGVYADDGGNDDGA
ncbi:MAG: hypothetical protein J0M17_26490, partial [Planctomycetes bacterium]|nr:hypothetical protein [Planctomycetota bacterium]